MEGSKLSSCQAKMWIGDGKLDGQKIVGDLFEHSFEMTGDLFELFLTFVDPFPPTLTYPP